MRGSALAGAQGPGFLVTGATGWLGRATLAVLADWLGPAVFAAKVDARSQQPRQMILANGLRLRTRGLSDPCVHNRYLLVHLAFLTRDHSLRLDPLQYRQANLELIGRGLQLADRAEGVVLVSSGAAVQNNGAADWDAAGNPYGFLKNVEEQSMRALGKGRFPTTVVRLWGAAGPDVVHPMKYAFSGFAIQALTQGVVRVRAEHAVWRRYCDARQMMDLCLRLALGKQEITFDSGGPLIEIRDLATQVAQCVNPNIPVEHADGFRGAPDMRYPEISGMDGLLAREQLTIRTLPDMIADTVNGLRMRIKAGESW